MVDASQGVEAQTLANAYLALDHNLEIIPVLNKCDMANADPDTVAEEIKEIIGIDPATAIHASAKTGQGIDEILEAIVTRVPPPQGRADDPLKMLIFDSWFDPYVGTVVMVRVLAGTVHRGQRVLLMATGKTYEVYQLGVFSPHGPGGNVKCR